MTSVCGQKTARTISGKVQEALFGGFSEEPASFGEVARPLMMPDELMILKGDRQLLLVENNYPIIAGRVAWFDDPKLKKLGRNLRK